MGKFLVGATLVAALGFGRRDCRCAGNEEEEDASSSILRGGNSRRRIVDYSEEVYNRQPLVTVVEGMPSQLGIASMSDPNGTLWCGGAPTYWITGHQPNDSPYCQIDGEWLQPRTAILPGRPNSRDRHYCVPFDVNHDGRTDIICTQGALQGLGPFPDRLVVVSASQSSSWLRWKLRSLTPSRILSIPHPFYRCRTHRDISDESEWITQVDPQRPWPANVSYHANPSGDRLEEHVRKRSFCVCGDGRQTPSRRQNQW